MMSSFSLRNATRPAIFTFSGSGVGDDQARSSKLSPPASMVQYRAKPLYAQPVAALDREALGLAPARRVPRMTVRRQEPRADVLTREVVGGVVRQLPHQLGAGRVGDELAAQVRAHPLRAVLDANSVSSVTHQCLQGRRGLARFERANAPIGLAVPPSCVYCC